MTAKRAHLIANSRSGQGKGSTLVDEARAICDELGFELVAYPIASPADFAKQSERAVEAAMQDQGVVIAAGGDGTIRGVAQAAHGKPVRFAAVPCGTFNFFARAHRLPDDHLEAFKLALTGEARPVRLGKINDHVFLINASIGVYAKAISDREASTDKFGRHRTVVILSSLFTFLRNHSPFKVDLVTDQKVHTALTSTIFIGNNALQLRDLDMDVGRCMKDNLLAVVMAKPTTRWETSRLILRGFLKSLEKDERLDSFCVDELTIRTHGKKTHRLALDGELITMSSPLHVRALPDILNLVCPAHSQGEVEEGSRA